MPGDFNEDLHPRDESGRFAEVGELQALGVKSVTLPSSKELRKMAVDAVRAATRAGFLPPESISAKNYGTRSIAFGSQSGIGLTTARLRKGLFADQVRTGHWAQENPVLHEIGHIEHQRATGGQYDVHSTWMMPDHAKKIAAKVSRYATHNPKEFVAETFAGHLSGKRYDADVMDFYKHHGGPDLPKDLKNAEPSIPVSLNTSGTLADAVKSLSAKTPVGSVMRSADWRAVPSEIKNKAQFSAQVESTRVLQAVQDRLTMAIKGNRTDGGALMSRERFISDMRRIAQDEGIATGEENLTDIASVPRLGLIYDMQVQQAEGYAAWKMDQGRDELYLWPCWELVREDDRETPRGEKRVKGEVVADPANSWKARWEAAGGTLYGGRMIARKDSDVWQNLGNGVGGWEDTLGNPYPPFAFSSGMGVENVDREEAIALGVMADEEEIEPDDRALDEGMEASAEGLDPLLIEALEKGSQGLIRVVGGVIKWAGNKLSNRDVSDQARDENGRWTDTGAGSDSDFEQSGFRYIPHDEWNPGDALKSSHVWVPDDAGELKPSDEEQDGVSVFKSYADAKKYAKYSRGWMVHVGGRIGIPAGDVLPGERMVKDPVVLRYSRRASDSDEWPDL